MPEQPKLEIKNLLTRNQLYYVAGFFAIVLSILISTFYSSNSLPVANTPVQVEIGVGESVEKIIDTLYQKKNYSKQV